MPKQAERTYLMKNNFIRLHQEGYSISEIADKYDLSTFSVYYHLQEIADENGVTRESLLRVPKTPTIRQYKEEEKKTRISVKELDNAFKEADTAIENLLTIIDEILEEEKAECVH